MTPHISVITVVRNDLHGLMQTIASVQMQASDNFEHVIWDGASDDGTSTWLAEATSLRNIRWVSAPDQGIYDAMNSAATLARGDILLFLNAGDRLVDSEVLAWVSDNWRSRGWRWAFGCIERWRHDVHVDRADQRPFDLRRFVAGRSWVPHQATFVSRVDFARLGGYDLDAGLAADQDLLLRFALESPPDTWERSIAHFQLGGAHSLASPRQREMEWLRMRTKNLVRPRHVVQADRVWTEVRVWILTARRRASPAKHRVLSLIRRARCR